MKIDVFDDWKIFAPLADCLSGDSVQALCQTATEYFLGANGWWGLTISDFDDLVSGRLAFLRKPLKDDVLSHYLKESATRFVADFETKIKAVTLEPTTDERAAAAKRVPMGATETMLQFMRSFYGCTYPQAEQATLSEYLLARRQTYNEQVTMRAGLAQMKKKKC